MAHGTRRRRDEDLRHRISTTEVDSALVSHPKVAEAAVIGRRTRSPVTAISFVSSEAGRGNESFRRAREHVVKTIGSIARPKRSCYPRIIRNPFRKDHAKTPTGHRNGTPLATRPHWRTPQWSSHPIRIGNRQR